MTVTETNRLKMAEKDIKNLQKELQELVGENPKIEVTKFENWGKTVYLDEVLSVTPEMVEEVQAVVKGTRQLGLRVRAVGSGHTWSPLFSDEGDVVMYVKKIKRPEGPNLVLIQNADDHNVKFVTMMTGVTTGEFKEFQLSHCISFPTNVLLRDVTMGGVVSTGCHGTGWDNRSVSDYVVSMRIVDSNGDLCTYSMEDDPDMMRAVQCNMGLWGILIDFTIKCNPMIFVETTTRWMKVKDLFYDKKAMKDLLTTNSSVELLWFPFNGISSWEAIEAVMEGTVDYSDWDPQEDEVWARLFNIPDSVHEIMTPKQYKAWDLKDWFNMKGFDIIDDFITTFPYFAPSLLRSQVQNVKTMRDEGAPIVQHLPHAIHFLDEIDEVPIHTMEYVFNLDKDCSNLLKAIQGVIDLVRSEALQGRFPMNFPLEMRFIADSDAYMAPSVCGNPKYGGTGNTCFLEITSITGTPHWEEFSKKCADIWKVQAGARPHWCKEWAYMDGIEDSIRKSYSKQMPQFLSALERSGADPDGMFFNSSLEKIFYPKGHPGRKKADSKKVCAADNEKNKGKEQNANSNDKSEATDQNGTESDKNNGTDAQPKK